jgi:hypothetical protein
MASAYDDAAEKIHTLPIAEPASLAAELAALNAACAPGQPGNTSATIDLASALIGAYRAGLLTVAPPATVDDDALVKVVAWEICKASGDIPDFVDPDDCIEGWARYVRPARAALAAVRKGVRHE